MHNNTHHSLLDTVGNTPLLRLNQVSELTGCDIYGKAEFLNPGGSVKDRAALGIINDAEEKQLIRPGGIIVEGTAGNTGIGLAVVANTRGYRTVFVLPENQSQEKIATLKAYGAEVRQVPVVPYKDTNHFTHTSQRLASELNASHPQGAIWADQFNNLANRNFHFESTGPEIWTQTEGQVDGFVCAAGTGGTLAGVSRYLKQQNPKIQIALSDPHGSGLYNFFTNGEMKAEGNSITEGIGNSRITENLADTEIDWFYRISDDEALPIVFDLMIKESICVGGSTGINVAAAVRLAQQLGPGHTIVTILCDSGLRYLGRIFNPAFLREKGLSPPSWMEE